MRCRCQGPGTAGPLAPVWRQYASHYRQKMSRVCRARRADRALRLRPATAPLASLTGDAFRGIALSSASIFCHWPVADLATMAMVPHLTPGGGFGGGVTGAAGLAAGARRRQVASRTAAPRVGEGGAERAPCRGGLRPDRWTTPAGGQLTLLGGLLATRVRRVPCGSPGYYRLAEVRRTGRYRCPHGRALGRRRLA